MQTQTHTFTDQDLPPNLKCQILSFIRITWPEGFQQENLYRDWITAAEHHPLHLVTTTPNNILVSYVGIVWKHLKHQGITYKTYGLSGVFTYPQYRGQGHGLALVRQGKAHLENSDGDIALFPSTLKNFYEKAGFQRMDNVTLLEGDPKKPTPHEEVNFMLLLSTQSKKHKNDFINHPIYFGSDVW